MHKKTTLTYSIVINAKAETVFDYLTDWPKQSEWILFTDVTMTSTPPNKLGTRLVARTHIGPVGFTDTMVITEWSPPFDCTVEHTGKIVKGIGVFSVEKITESKSKFIWNEVNPVPFGAMGGIGLRIIQPFLGLLFNRSLKKMRDNIEQSQK